MPDVINHDKVIWRETEGDALSNCITVNPSGGIGLNVGGRVIVLTLLEWFELGKRRSEMTDKELIAEVARVWVSGGGDADGISYCWRKIIDAVNALKDENK